MRELQRVKEIVREIQKDSQLRQALGRCTFMYRFSIIDL